MTNGTTFYGFRYVVMAICLALGLMCEQALAAGMGGSWSGTVTQSEPSMAYATEMQLFGPNGSISYPGLRCGGILSLEGKAGNGFSYREHITWGDCIDSGLVVIRPVNGDWGMLDWRWSGDGVSVIGVLRGSGKEE